MSLAHIDPATQPKLFGRFLTDVVKMLGWTQVEFAKRSGLHRLVIGRHINGAVFPERATRIRYANTFQIDPDEFERHLRDALTALARKRESKYVSIVERMVSGIQHPANAA